MQASPLAGRRPRLHSCQSRGKALGVRHEALGIRCCQGEEVQRDKKPGVKLRNNTAQGEALGGKKAEGADSISAHKVKRFFVFIEKIDIKEIEFYE